MFNFDYSLNGSITDDQTDVQEEGIHNVSSEFLMSIDQSVHFLCGSGEIISVLGRCDHARDCLDNSDEFDCEETGERRQYLSLFLKHFMEGHGVV